MTILHIFKLDSDDAVSKLNEGEHIIGRGPLLQCDDRRVSRNHGIINIAEDVVTITSTHVNPCFYQSASSKTITILTKGTPVSLEDGDKFALLADKYWYKIKLMHKNGGGFKDSNIGITGNKHDLKRVIEEEETPSCSKKVKIEEGNEASAACSKLDMHDETFQSDIKTKEVNVECEAENLEVVLGDLKSQVECKENPEEENKSFTTLTRQKYEMSDSDGDTDIQPVRKKAKCTKQEKVHSSDDALHDDKVKAMLFSSDEDDGPEITNSPKTENSNQNNFKEPTITDAENTKDGNRQEKENNQGNDNFDPGCSSTTGNTNQAETSDSNKKKQYRDRCWYGAECYRKKQSHFTEYSHPGDSDYDSDPHDDRPMCSFGGACYRRNKDHRKAYKHPRKTEKPPDKKTRKVKAKRKTQNQQFNETPEDDYDFDDPFIDDSESEYEVESSSVESDSDWSAGSEESGNKRLLKEAKKFTRTKKD